MQTILYTDTDRVRSVLGVDEKDVSDSSITARDLEKELRLDLLSWMPAHSTLHGTGSSSAASDTEQSLADAITLFSTYYCAVLVVKSLQLAAPQTVSDGKNTMSRFATMDWQQLTFHLKERLAFYKVFIQNSASSSTPTAPVYNPFQGALLSIDPVTSTR